MFGHPLALLAPANRGFRFFLQRNLNTGKVLVVRQHQATQLGT